MNGWQRCIVWSLAIVCAFSLISSSKLIRLLKEVKEPPKIFQMDIAVSEEEGKNKSVDRWNGKLSITILANKKTTWTSPDEEEENAEVLGEAIAKALRSLTGGTTTEDQEDYGQEIDTSHQICPDCDYYKGLIERKNYFLKEQDDTIERLTRTIKERDEYIEYLQEEKNSLLEEKEELFGKDGGASPDSDEAGKQIQPQSESELRNVVPDDASDGNEETQHQLQEKGFQEPINSQPESTPLGLPAVVGK